MAPYLIVVIFCVPKATLFNEVHFLVSPLGIVPPVPSGDEQPSKGTTTGSPVQKCREVLPAGVLVVEPYCWKDVVLKPPLLSITTTAAQTAVLSLPPG